ncbi:DUF3431 domain-containing protein [Octadecabacter sp.]|nr:DUF3431 domain-containing protein [Octadecabacter sp.]
MTLIISNYNYIPVELSTIITELGGTIYDQSDNIETQKALRQKFSGCYTKSPHTGHNLSDYCNYIIENYHDLPTVIRFIKGNIYPRHFESTNFFDLIRRNIYLPLYNKPETSNNLKYCGNLGSNLYYEINDPWYMQTKPARYFSSYDDFMSFMFTDYQPQKFVVFNPGACQIVLREQVTRYPLQFWKNIKHIVSYRFFPAEAYILERAFFSLFTGSYNLSQNAKTNLISSGNLESRTVKVMANIKHYHSTQERVKRKFGFTK